MNTISGMIQFRDICHIHFEQVLVSIYNRRNRCWTELSGAGFVRFCGRKGRRGSRTREACRARRRAGGLPRRSPGRVFSRPAYRRCGPRGRRESGRGASRAARKRTGAEGESGLPFEFDPLRRFSKRIAGDRGRGFNERTAESAHGGDVLKLLRARRCPTAGGLPPGATDG